MRALSLAITASLALAAHLGPPSHAAPNKTGTVVVLSGAEGAAIRIDDAPVGVTPLPGPWTLPVGKHTLAFAAAGQPEGSLSFEIKPGQTTTLRILQAPVMPTQALEPIRRVVPVGPSFPVATTGYITAGAGLAALGAAVWLGLQADELAGQARDLDRRDPARRRADLDALVDDSERAALTANLLYGIGGVALLGGAALALFGQDGLLAGPVRLTPGPGGAALGGRF